jgi:hypothetical protein
VAMQAFELASSGTDAEIVAGESLLFSNNGTTSGDISHTPGGSTFTINTTGTYLLKYVFSIDGGIGSGGQATTILIDESGSGNIGSIILDANNPDSFTGQIQLSLTSGDQVDFSNSIGGNVFDLDLDPFVGISFEFQKLD